MRRAATIALLSISLAVSAQSTELDCLAEAIYFEARSEPYAGQLAVAQTILNRVNDPRWPGDICNVVHQKNQFSYYWDGKPEVIEDNMAYSAALRTAHHATELPDITGGATHYHTTQVKPVWRHALRPLLIINNHIFYREP